MYKKPNNDSLYLTKKFNHPPPMLQKLSKSISKGILDILSNESILTNHSLLRKCLEKDNVKYNVSLKCNPTQDQDENNQQGGKRNGR